MDKPLISILIPCYNVEKYLPQCLDSIINQTYSSIHIVLIDDGSKDGTWDVLCEYATMDDRIEIYHQENQGVSATRNYLLNMVKGDYVLFVDSDDWIESNMIEFLVDKALGHNADIAICGMVKNAEICRDEYQEEVLSQAATVKKFLFHKELTGSLWNKLIKTSLLHSIRLDNQISYGEDALFCWHVLQRVSTVVQTSKQLYHYRMNETSISHQKFGDKKLTGHNTWRIITEETAVWWPQYLNVSQARWGMEDMYLLRQATQGGYKKDYSIQTLQETVRKFLPQMRATGLLVGKEIFNANMMCRWYGYGVLYARLHELKSKL